LDRRGVEHPTPHRDRRYRGHHLPVPSRSVQSSLLLVANKQWWRLHREHIGRTHDRDILPVEDLETSILDELPLHEVVVITDLRFNATPTVHVEHEINT